MWQVERRGCFVKPDEGRLAKSLAWWRGAVIYQIYPRSWADLNGDGVGDLAGITGRLEYLIELGVDAVWLSPFYVSPQADGGYDVADYRDVDPMFGTLQDFDALLSKAHGLGLRVLVDLVPNHTSDEHQWFVSARKAPPGSPERSRYIFVEGRGERGELAPNNWKSMFGGSAWTRLQDSEGDPEQWYLHLFDVKQPDLNWQSEDVKAEFRSIIRFWLDRGVDGFRVDVAHGLIKQAGLPDCSKFVGIPDSDAPDPDAPDPDAADPDAFPVDLDDANSDESAAMSPMWDQDGVHDIYRDWRRITDSYAGERILVAEAWVNSLDRLARYVRPSEMHQAFNFEFLLCAWSAEKLRKVISRSIRANDAVGASTTWVLSNHDVVRHASRLGLEDGSSKPNGIGCDDPQPDRELGLRRARAATLLMLALPGTAYLYQGEELGLPEHTCIPDQMRQDPTWRRSKFTERGRDGCRIPFPWQSDAPCCGFSTSDKPWLPQPETYASYALDLQLQIEDSTFEMYRTALKIRRQMKLGYGLLEWLKPNGSQIVNFVNGSLVVWVNTGPSAVSLPKGLDVLLASAPLPNEESKILPGNTTVWLTGESGNQTAMDWLSD